MSKRKQNPLIDLSLTGNLYIRSGSAPVTTLIVSHELAVAAWVPFYELGIPHIEAITGAG